MPAVSAQIPMRVHDLTPEEIAEWAQWEDRVSCRNCGHRSGQMCVPNRIGIVPVHLLHRCDSFTPASRGAAR